MLHVGSRIHEYSVAAFHTLYHPLSETPDVLLRCGWMSMPNTTTLLDRVLKEGIMESKLY